MKNKNIQGVTGHIIKVNNGDLTIDKTESGLYISTRFKVEEHIRQYAEVIATDGSDGVEVGDILFFHYNVTAYQYKNRVKTHSQYFLEEDEDKTCYYHVPHYLTYAFLKDKDSSEAKFTNGYCFVETRKDEEKKTSSGIVVELEKEIDSTKNNYGVISQINSDNTYNLSKGDKVIMPTYPDYEITLPNNEKFWCVEYKLFLAKIEDD